jgi:uncharacterized protein
MSATYVIDGYNLLHAMGILGSRVGPGGLEKARSRLLGLLAGTFEAKSAAITVVFDAARALPGGTPEIEVRGLHVVFAVGEQEADDVIERLIRQASAPKSLHVVSDDRRVQRAARRRHGVALGCEQFLQRLDKMRRRQAPAPPSDKQEGLSEEETRSWLQEFGDVERDPALKRAFEKDL